jgi:hypothetical protein
VLVREDYRGRAASVKIVLKRKDAEALVARLNALSERERKARMAELKGEFRAGAQFSSVTPKLFSGFVPAGTRGSPDSFR